MTKELAKMKMYCDFPQARPYSFNFGVDDEYSGVDYTRAESRYRPIIISSQTIIVATFRSDAGVTRGSYSVALPDGRVQTVSYTGNILIKT